MCQTNVFFHLLRHLSFFQNLSFFLGWFKKKQQKKQNKALHLPQKLLLLSSDEQVNPVA